MSFYVAIQAQVKTLRSEARADLSSGNVEQARAKLREANRLWASLQNL